MGAFNPAGLEKEYGQLDTLLGDGLSGGGADTLFLNMLDQYDQVTGRDGYRDHDGMVGELLDALNRHLNPIGLDATRSGVVYCNVVGAPDLHEVDGAVEAFMEEDWDRIIQTYDAVYPALRDLWYGEAALEGFDAENHIWQSIDGDQVMYGGKAAYGMYRFTLDTADKDSVFPEYVQYEFSPEEMAAFVTNEFDDPDHATREKPAKDQTVSLAAEATASRDASQALDGHETAANERPMDR